MVAIKRHAWVSCTQTAHNLDAIDSRLTQHTEFTPLWNAIEQAEKGHSRSVCNRMDESCHPTVEWKNPIPQSLLLHVSIDRKVNRQLSSVGLEVRLPLGDGDQRRQWWGQTELMEVLETCRVLVWEVVCMGKFQFMIRNFLVLFNKSWGKKEQYILLRFFKENFQLTDSVDFQLTGLFYCWNNNIKIKITFNVR